MKIIFNGDDLGFSRGCNYAMIDCFQNGLLRSASLMVNMPGAEHAVQLMKENPGLSVGIHFNLTAGRPLTCVPSLIKTDGTFNKGILKDSSHVSREEMKQEMQAQLDRFIELTGQLPDHINSHHGLEQVQYALELMQEFSRKYDRPMRGFLRDGFRKVEDIDFDTPVLYMPDSMEADSEAHVIQWLKQQKPDALIEIGAHPGYVDQTVFQMSSLAKGRAYDAMLFQSPEIAAYLNQNGHELIDYRAIPRVNYGKDQ